MELIINQIFLDVFVTEEPLLLPRLTVEKSKYSNNERIRANCTSEAAFPAANLTWLINNIQLRENPPAIRVHTRLLTDQSRGLETAVSSLALEARPGYFVEGRLQLTCVATQYHIYRRNATVLLQEDTPQIAPVMGATAPHSHPESRASLMSTDCTILLLLVLTVTVLSR
ncbi:uncharacterized protein LOC120353317 [Nilaparvata lugens]|uniref:uncharacterized protein LOC120353317 n=1 Tax=Nilaparvata lugens TaxID=108931 RepID=UPI00193E847E|nr:uncharacterized protein LOC120353317 [Nilaparvata lugens]